MAQQIASSVFGPNLQSLQPGDGPLRVTATLEAASVEGSAAAGCLRLDSSAALTPVRFANDGLLADGTLPVAVSPSATAVY